MTAAQLLRRLDDLGVELTRDGDRISYRSLAGRLPAELVAELRENRDALRDLVDRRSRLGRHPVHVPTGPRRSGPLSRTQRSVWATDWFREDGTYNLVGTLRLRGVLDEAAFTAALADLVERHPSLRTVFTAEQGTPVQQVLPVVEPRPARHDLSDLEPRAALAEALRRCAQQAGTRLPLDTEPPVRLSLFRLAEDDHVFAAVLHHVIADGVSLGVLLDDLARCYNARRAGGKASAPGSALDMVDYARWEADQHSCGDSSAARRFWREQLAGAVLGPLPLPPTAEPVDRGGLLSVRVDPAATAAVRGLAAESRASAFMVVCAAVSTMLQRYTGREDLVAGMAVARRDREGTAALVGLLLDMVPLRLDLSGAPTFRELVRRTRGSVLGAAGHPLPPDDAPSGASGPDSAQPGLAAPTPFHVVLTDAGAEGDGPRFDGLTAERLDVSQSGAKYDLNFLLRDQGDSLLLDVEFDRRLLAERDVRAMVATVRRILRLGTANPDGTAAELAAAPYDEPAAGAFGVAPERTPGPDETLHGRLSQVAAERADAVAVRCDGAELTYRELDLKVRQVARGLAGAGVRAGDRVAVALPRGLDLIVAMIGIMARGAACVVLDDSWPASRVEQVLADSGARVTVAAETDREHGRVAMAELVRRAEAEGETALPPVPAAVTAYVIFTSGSTGRPKGVQVSHRNVLSLLDGTGRAFGFGADDTWTLFHSCSFDFSVWEIFGCLLHGGRLVVVPKWVTREPEAFAHLLRRERVTVLSQTPSALSVMLPAIARNPGAVERLRYVVFGGEALERRLVDQWHEAFGDATRLVNMYGITETTVHASWRWFTPGEPAGAESEIGRPLPGTALHVLHSDGSPALDRCVGEIHVGGPQVSQGYLGRPRETALRFVPDPYSGVPGARLYRSGDFARREASGLSYLGRRDGQVQVNGFRVELSEIEDALLACPGVAAAAAAVAVREDGPLVVAAVVPDGPEQPDCAELLRTARAALPGYMAPQAVGVIAELPLTVNGKLDRAAVAAAGLRAGSRTRSTREPDTAAEAALLDVVREVFGADAGLDDDFFGLGGDSMRAIRLVGLARERGLALTVQDVYAAPGLVDLAARAQEAAADPDAAPHAGPYTARAPFDGLPGGRDGFAPDVVDAYPMTALQTGMIYHRELAPESGVYHIVLSYRVGGVLDPDSFRGAVAAVMERHPILRTSFDLGHALGPMQQVHGSVPPPVVFEDLDGLSAPEQAERIAAVVREETATEFLLSRPGLFRLAVLRRSAEDYQVVFSHHHAVLDGWSVNVFFEELSLWYGHLLSGGGEAPQPPLLTGFADYVALEQRAVADPGEREFWRERISSEMPLLAPERPAEPVMRQFHGSLPDGTVGRLTEAARQMGVPLKAVLLAAHLRVLSWLTGHDEVATGLTTLCRPETADGDRMLGLFLNEVPLRVRLEDQTWAELARQVHTEELATAAHRWYPHASMQRDHGSRPILDTNFNFTDFHTTKALIRAGRLEVLEVQEIESTHYPLGVNFTVDVRTRELRMIIEYDQASLTRRTAELTAEAHRRILAALAADPGAPFRRVTLPGVAQQADGTEPTAVAAPAPSASAVRTPGPDAPLTEAEAALAEEVRQVWAEVLGAQDFDLTSNFFEVGGSSLTAMQVVGRLRARYGGVAAAGSADVAEPSAVAYLSALSALSMSTFMEAPTVAGLARALHAVVHAGPAPSSAPSSAPSPVAGPAQDRTPDGAEASTGRFPLTAAQRQMWLLAERLPGVPLFGMPGAMRVDGPFDAALLQRVLTDLARRHEALRTRIEVVDGVPVQVVAPTPDVEVPVVDLRGHADPTAACDAALVAAAREPIPLDRAPLMRARVFRTADQEHVVFLNVHHLICDGWSLGMLLDEAAHAYGESAAGGEPGSRPPALGSGSLALARSEWLASAEAERQRGYWAERLSGPWPSLRGGPGSRLAPRRSVSPVDGLRLAGHRTRLPAATVAALREAGRRHGLTDFMLVLTAYASALSTWSGRSDIRVGAMVANRVQPGTESTVGLLANTVVLRVDTSSGTGDDSGSGTGPAELARRARQACNEAFDNQELPFEEVLVGLTADAPRRPEDGALFEVMLVMQEQRRETAAEGGPVLTPHRPGGGAFGRPVAPTTSDFVLAVTPDGEELELELLYRSAVTPEAEAVGLLKDIAAEAAETAAALGSPS